LSNNKNISSDMFFILHFILDLKKRFRAWRALGLQNKDKIINLKLEIKLITEKKATHLAISF
jgi:hypothetical protein